MILKGGTAINFTVFNLPRLSVDIDMDYTPNDSRDNMLVARKQITGMIREYMEGEGYSLSRASRFSHSLDAFYYNYLNAGGNKDIIKIELNYSLRAHIYEASHRSILNDAFKSDIKIRTVAPIEIFAAKGNALISRAATRDLYDWGNMMEQKLFEGERDLFRKCFAFYTTISADKNRINRGFDTSAIDTLDFMKIRRDLFPVIKKKNDFLTINDKSKLIKIKFDDILYIETSKRQLIIHTINGHEIIKMSIRKLEKLLNKDFFRCHNSFIVNLEKINKIDVSDIYINNATIPISKHRRKQLKARLIEVLGDKLC